MTVLDGTDAAILRALDADPSATVVALAQRLGLARNTVHARWQRLQRALGPMSRRVPAALAGYPLLAFVSIEISQGDTDHTVVALSAIAEVQELQAITGDGDLLARVVARDAEHLHRVTRQIVASPGVVRTRTSMALREYIPLRTAPLLDRLAPPPAQPPRPSPRDHAEPP